MAERNKGITSFLDFLDEEIRDLCKDGRILSETTKESLQQLTEKQLAVDKSADLYLAKLSETCKDFEKQASNNQQEVKKKFNKCLKTLKETKRNEEKKLNTEDNVLEEITNKMNTISVSQKALGQKEINLKQKQNVDIERDRATFKLLSNTFRIKWDYTCSNEKIQGFVSGKEPVPFCIDKKEYDNFYTANYLWDLI